MSIQTKKKVIIVLPAYNAAKTLKNTLDDIPKGVVDDLILVDDASSDNTVEIAKKLGLKVIVHKENRGYGGNQKTCYREALKRGADIIIMLHPDHQYPAESIPELIKPLQYESCDAVLGSRMLKSKEEVIAGGMPEWKYIANKFLTWIENRILKLGLSEYHSGFRTYSRKYLESVDFLLNSNQFVFDTEIIIQGLIHGFKFKEIPIPTKYFKDASTVGFKRGLIYGVRILISLIKYLLHKYKIKRIRQFS